MKRFFLLLALVASTDVAAADKPTDITYNDFATLRWIQSGDGCDEGRDCFQVPGLDPSLIKISRPSLSSGALIIGQTSAGEKWLVYDLAQKAFVVPPGEESQALDAWIGRDLPAPEFWDAKIGGKGLRSTKKSLFDSWGFGLFLLTPVLLAVGFPICCVFGWRAVKRYRADHLRKDLVTAGLFAGPGLLILFLFFRVFVPVFWR